MGNKVLIGFFVFLVAFLLLPVVVQQAPEGSGDGAEPGQSQKPVPEAPELSQPPLLNEANLIGTQWQAQIDQFVVKISVAPSGVLYATHPLAKSLTGADYLEGRWRVDYDKVYVSFSLSGREFSTVFKISGSNLYFVEGVKYNQVERLY